MPLFHCKDFDELLAGEKIYTRIQKHPIVFFQRITSPLSICMSMLGVVMLLLYKEMTTSTEFLSLFIWGMIGLGFLIVCSICIVQMYKHFIDWKYDVLLVTNIRLIEINQHFLFGRDVESIDILDIINIRTLHQGLLNSLFQFGDLEVESYTPKVNEFVIRNISDPEITAKKILTLKQHIEEQRVKNKIAPGVNSQSTVS